MTVLTKIGTCWILVMQIFSAKLALGSFNCAAEGDSLVCANDELHDVSVLFVPGNDCKGKQTVPPCWVSSDCDSPFTVASGSRLTVVKTADGGSMCGFQLQSQQSFGVHEGHLYSPPFQGLAHIGQSYQDCRPGMSHCGQFGDAIDFGLERGAQIVAARDGVVVAVVDNHGDGGSCVDADGAFNPSAFPHIKANEVHIRHSDGTVAQYVHLQKGISVNVGDRVQRGDLLGLNGNSGCSSGPHLHFQVLGSSRDTITPVPSPRDVPSNSLIGSKWHPGFFQTQTVPVRFDFPCIRDFIPRVGMSLLGSDATASECFGSTSLCSPCSIPSASRPLNNIGCHANIKGDDGSLREICCENTWSHTVQCDFSLAGDVFEKVQPQKAVIRPGTSMVFGIMRNVLSTTPLLSLHGCNIVPDDTETCTASTKMWSTAPSAPGPAPQPTSIPTPAPTLEPTTTTTTPPLPDGTNVVNFEAGSLTSGGLTFTKISGTVDGQPTRYSAAQDSVSPNGGGDFLFRTDFNSDTKVGDKPVGVYESTQFRLESGDITFDFGGSGGYIALCMASSGECKKRSPASASTTMTQGSFGAQELQSWVGLNAFFKLVDDQSGGWGHLSIDNIVFHGSVDVAPVPRDAKVIDFETGSLTSGGLTFTRISGTVDGQPIRYSTALDSVNPNGGGDFLFRTDFNSDAKVGDRPIGVYQSTQFRLESGDITFDFAGSGGYIALCMASSGECKKRSPASASATMTRGSFETAELQSWVGLNVFFKLVDDQSGGWGHLSIDNIVFHGNVDVAPVPLDAKVIDFEAGSLSSGGLTFTKISGTVDGQPIRYSTALDSVNPSGGGDFLFRTDFNSDTKVGDRPIGVYQSTQFGLKPGDITFDFAGSGGYIALCLASSGECKKRRPDSPSTAMTKGSFTSQDLKLWVGLNVFFKLVDDKSGGWGHLSIDNIVFHGDVPRKLRR